MKPFLETLPVESGASWSMLNRRLDDGIPFQWHHHPELELTLTLNSRGQRFIGDHVGGYDDEDLVLIGPNLPHTWSSSEKIRENEPHVALVLWFRQEWIDDLARGAVELQPVKALVDRARSGLKFSDRVARSLRQDITALFALPAPERLLGLLAVLTRLAKEETAEPLSSERVSVSEPESRERIDRVLSFIHASYAEEIRIEQLAEIAALSPSGLHRMFARFTHSSVTDYLMRLRIGDACARLSATDQPIQHIAAVTGYGSLANFNRQFKRLRGMTPREYRLRFRKR